MKLKNEDIADPILYRTYWSLMLSDILHKLGYDATQENKSILHGFHKDALGYKSISGLERERLSKFLLEVVVFWGERGIFVRSSRKHEIGIEDKDLADIWDLL